MSVAERAQGRLLRLCSEQALSEIEVACQKAKRRTRQYLPPNENNRHPPHTEYRKIQNSGRQIASLGHYVYRVR